MHIFSMTEHLKILQYALNINTRTTNIFVGTITDLFKNMYNLIIEHRFYVVYYKGSDYNDKSNKIVCSLYDR